MPRNNFTQCQEPATIKQLAGFSYVGDHDSVIQASAVMLIDHQHLLILTLINEFLFIQHSKIDVDIKDIEAFMDNSLRIFPVENGLGNDFYQFQQYSSSYASIQGLARSAGREVVPSFASFLRYFNDDANYADSIIVSCRRSYIFIILPSILYYETRTRASD